MAGFYLKTIMKINFIYPTSKQAKPQNTNKVFVTPELKKTFAGFSCAAVASTAAAIILNARATPGSITGTVGLACLSLSLFAIAGAGVTYYRNDQERLALETSSK